MNIIHPYFNFVYFKNVADVIFFKIMLDKIAYKHYNRKDMHHLRDTHVHTQTKKYRVITNNA